MSKDAVFDEETYAKAKPLFITVVNDLKDAHFDLRETITAIVRIVVDRLGADAAQNMSALCRALHRGYAQRGCHLGW